MEPVERAGDLSDEVGEVVATLDMGQFMQKHHPAPRFGPGAGFGRQHDHRPPQPPRQRERNGFGGNDAYASTQAKPMREFGGAAFHVRIDGVGAAGDLGNANAVEKQPAEEDQGTREPEQQGPLHQGKAGGSLPKRSSRPYRLIGDELRSLWCLPRRWQRSESARTGFGLGASSSFRSSFFRSCNHDIIGVHVRTSRALRQGSRSSARRCACNPTRARHILPGSW